jgi:UDP-N-acetylglucosamine acyltransferase
MSVSIHPTAVIHNATRLAPTVSVGPYAVIEDGVELGEGTVVRAHAVIRSGTITGAHCVIDSHAVVGGLPQDIRFDPKTPSGVRLGDGVQLREGVTVHRATREGVFTEVGAGAFLMANAHVGHDCIVGANAILANNVMLGGFVSVGASAFLGGAAAIHQHVRIGESAMIGGVARCSQDVAPFVMMAERDEVSGLNLVGLKRRGFSRETIRGLKRAFHGVFDGGGNPRKRAAALLEEAWSEEEAVAVQFLQFFLEGKRGFARPLAANLRRGTDPEGE